YERRELGLGGEPLVERVERLDALLLFRELLERPLEARAVRRELLVCDLELDLVLLEPGGLELQLRVLVLELRSGRLELLRALDHAPLQRLVQPSDLLLRPLPGGDVVREDELGRPLGEGDGVRRDLDVDERPVLLPVPPRGCM